MLEDLQNQIYDVLEEANQVLPQADALYYGGTFLTGDTDDTDVLFLGINPGHGDWESRARSFTRQPYRPQPCKFAGEYDDDQRLARQIVDIIFDGDQRALERCAETSVRSYFATPDTKVLDRQMGLLGSSGIAEKHRALMDAGFNAVVKTVSPRHIVCIGLTTFQDVVRRAGINSADIEMKSEPSASGKTEPVYYKRTSINGIPVHGVLHLSGGHLSGTMTHDLRATFAELR